MSIKAFLGLLFIVLVIVIGLDYYNNSLIDENEVLKLATEKLNQPYDKYQLLTDYFIIENIKLS